MGQRGPQPERAFPEAEWLDRNVAMLHRVEPERRENYLIAVELVRGEDAAKAVRAKFRRLQL